MKLIETNLVSTLCVLLFCCARLAMKIYTKIATLFRIIQIGFNHEILYGGKDYICIQTTVAWLPCSISDNGVL